MAGDPVTNSILGKVGELLVDPICKSFSYLTNYNGNIEALRGHVKTLKAVRQDVQDSIDEARNTGAEIKNEVENWASEVDKVMPEAESILSDDANADWRCFNRWFLHLAKRYCLSAKSEKISIEIANLRKECDFLDNVSKTATLSRGVSNAQLLLLESTKEVLRAVMEALKENIFIGICAMGGVGKTTLVREIRRRVEEEDKLFRVVTVEVSQKVDVKKIQQEIAGPLGLHLEDISEHGRAEQLYTRLLNVPKILIILDDVWAGLELDNIGIPFGIDHFSCKIVVTTRRKQVCNAMVLTSVQSSKIILLNVLSDVESWELFKRNVGDVIESPKLNSVAKDICKECGGLPIALETVGRAMRRKDHLGEDYWKDAALQLKKSMPTTIENMKKVVYKCIMSSFDYLEEKQLKSLFLLCCLFPEGYDICIEVLVRYGFGLEIFEGVSSVQEARGRAHSIINELKDSCLLLGSKKGAGYIKMHDVVRDAAKSYASDDYFVKAGEKLTEWPNVDPLKNYTGLSVMHCDINGYPDFCEWEYCSSLRILLMQSNPIRLPMPERVFKGMKALKVLDQSGYFQTETLFYPRELEPVFSHLKNLQTLIIGDCRIADSTALKHLKSLQILSLASCEFKSAPVEIGELTNLKLLDLEECELSKEVSGPIFPRDAVIPRLSKLEELYMSSSLIGSRGLIISELKSLHRLSTLTLSIPDFGCIPEGFTFPDLEVFKLYTSRSFEPKTEPDYLRLSGLVNGGKILEISSLVCVNPLLKKTNHLCLSSFKGMRNILPCLSPERDGLPALRILEIDNCEEMENLINAEEWNIPSPEEQSKPIVLFSELEKLALSSLQTFTGFCHGALPHEMILVFAKLRYLKFWKCPKLLNAFSSFHLLQRVNELEELEVDSCRALECVFNIQPGKSVTKEKEMLLPQLRKLVLMFLPELKHVQNGLHGSLHLHNLQTVDIYECNKLKVIFHLSVARSLTQLKELFISRCDELETVFEGREEEEIAAKVTFPLLATLKLLYLPELAGLCKNNLLPIWPSLETVEMRHCPKMETFVTSVAQHGNQSTPKLKEIKLDRRLIIQSFVGEWSEISTSSVFQRWEECVSK